MGISERLFFLVEQRGLKRSALAGAANRDVSQVSRWLSGKDEPRLRIEEWKALADEAGVGLVWLATGEGSPEGDPATLSDEDIKILEFVHAAGLGYAELVRRLTASPPPAPPAPWPHVRHVDDIATESDRGPRRRRSKPRAPASPDQPVGEDERPDPLGDPAGRRR